MKNIVLLIAILTISAVAEAAKEGHGGWVVKCPGQPPKLLDLYEQEMPVEYGYDQEMKRYYVADPGKIGVSPIYDPSEPKNPDGTPVVPVFNIIRTNDPVDSQIRAAIKRLAVNGRYEADAMSSAYNDITQPGVVVDVPDDSPLGPSLKDIGYDIKKIEKNGCLLDWVANYIDIAPKTVYLKRSLYNKMLPTDQAALWVHEARYRLERMTFTTTYDGTDPKSSQFANSRVLRNDVRTMFSDFPPNKYFHHQGIWRGDERSLEGFLDGKKLYVSIKSYGTNCKKAYADFPAYLSDQSVRLVEGNELELNSLHETFFPDQVYWSEYIPVYGDSKCKTTILARNEDGSSTVETEANSGKWRLRVRVFKGESEFSY